MTFNKKGQLIVIESGSDGSGKKTQANLLVERLIAEGKNVRKIDFPRYEEESSSLIRMYLRGEFGMNADSVDPYTASTFYAVDRFASYKTDWSEFYLSGGIVVADRYTTSNMVHQTSKIPKAEQDKYLNWLMDLEFKHMAIPQPDLVILLDVPVNVTSKWMEGRESKMDGSQTKDIHENDLDYLKRSYDTAIELAKKFEWHRLICVDKDSIRSIDSIHDEIYQKVISTI